MNEARIIPCKGNAGAVLNSRPVIVGAIGIENSFSATAKGNSACLGRYDDWMSRKARMVPWKGNAGAVIGTRPSVVGAVQTKRTPATRVRGNAACFRRHADGKKTPNEARMIPSQTGCGNAGAMLPARPSIMGALGLTREDCSALAGRAGLRSRLFRRAELRRPTSPCASRAGDSLREVLS